MNTYKLAGAKYKDQVESILSMKRLACVCLLMAALFLSSCSTTDSMSHGIVAGKNAPRTAVALRDNPANFHFVVISDRTGEHREGVFRQALQQVNLMEPAFVINIGDLVEGYTENRAFINVEWDEVDDMIGELEMPFFFVPGNHDMGNDVMRDVWRDRLGRDYYHFLYKDVLFLVFNTEDPPLPVTEETKDDIAAVSELLKTDRRKAFHMVMGNEKLRKATLDPKISEEQVEYFRRAIENNPDVRWTFVFLHKPAWEYRDASFQKIESMLQGRAYTVIAGHHHSYKHLDVNGKDYIRLGTTGGGQRPDDPAALDHVMFISMTDKEPKIVNLRLDGIFDRTGKSIANQPKWNTPDN